MVNDARKKTFQHLPKLQLMILLMLTSHGRKDTRKTHTKKKNLGFVLNFLFPMVGSPIFWSESWVVKPRMQIDLPRINGCQAKDFERPSTPIKSKQTHQNLNLMGVDGRGFHIKLKHETKMPLTNITVLTWRIIPGFVSG